MIVLKYGGSSLATPEQILQRAQQIAHMYKQGKKILVVVSAMGQTTNDLVKLAYKITARPHRRELDMLLTTGERISMSLLSMALNDLNCPAISFTGSQAGILTESNHNDARIKEIKPIRVQQELEKNKIVIVAGFQGVDPQTKEITTLGRGGSDTTAIAMAHYFNATRCQILKDVDGIYSADPKLIAQSQKIKEVSWEQLHSMCAGGAKVVHLRAAELAREQQVPFEIASADDPKVSTHINGQPSHSVPKPLAVNCIAPFLQIKWPSAQNDLFNHLHDQGLTLPNILADDQPNTYYLWGDPEIIKPVTTYLSTHHKERVTAKDLCSINLTWSHPPKDQQQTVLQKTLKTENIQPIALLSANLNSCIVLHESQLTSGLKSIHNFVLN